jgi:leader peptidase (prepilin peptidase) / N-methyltransferase
VSSLQIAIALAAALGACFGSFAAVVVDRWPRGESVVRPPSRCEGCRRRLSAWEMVPVLSWAALRGRCRTCGVRIGAQGPAIEAACAALAGLSVAVYGITWSALSVAVLLVVLVPVVVIDLRHRLIPDLLVLPATLVAGLAAILADPSRWWLPVAGGLGAAGFLFFLWVVHPQGMGLGDVKLAALIGAVLGVSAIPALAIAFGAGALLGLVLLARMGSRARRVAVPFGPFLAAGAVAALWVGPTLIDWYAGRLG